MHRHASLNRIYRLVWSHVHQTWIVVSETARGRGKRANRKRLLAAATLAAAHLAQAGPTGGQVTAGQGAIQQSGTTTTVTQSSQNLSLSWQSFNTVGGETVNFVQPSPSAIAVNRILGTDATRFFGKLNANGQVWLINPNGVLFGAGAQVNVGGLVASALDVDDRELGSATRHFSGTGGGAIVNQGDIRTMDGGYVAFVGNTVRNQGTIAAPSGSVALGAGNEVTLSFAGNSLLRMQVDRTTLDNLAENGGLIRADGGAVVLSAGAKDAVLASVVNNTGVIEARSLRDVNGSIVLDGGQQSTVTSSGTLDASGRGAGQTGGSVKMLGDHVVLAAGGTIDVSGDAGGGGALVGGNFLGQGMERNALDTTVAAGSAIAADALASGNGGKVAVWSNGDTRYDGRISARGGAAGGDGGAVETSGHVLKVGADASVNTLATRGIAGNWLLDPQDLVIGGFVQGDGDITGQQITAALQTSSVTIMTGPSVSCANMGSCSTGRAGSGDIIMADGSNIGQTSSLEGNYIWDRNTNLTLSAYRNIEFLGTANIDASAGSGNIVLRADNTGTGTGTVKFSSDAQIYGNGTLKIYYNPTSYTTPTDFASLQTPQNGPNIQFVNLSSYMLINFTGTIADKTYDRTTTAAYSGFGLRGALPPGITVDMSGATATFADANAGTNKTVVISGILKSGTDAAKYELNGLTNKTATINKANLALTGVSANNKTYDGTVAATLSGSATVSPLGGDVVTISGNGTGSTFTTKNAGTGKAVTVTGYTLGGASAANYNLVMPTGLSANIGKANLNVGGITAANKTYDATTAATLNGTAFVAAFGSDAVSVIGSGVGTFADRNAGNGKAVAVTGYSLAGTDAANYSIVQPAGLMANIGKASIAVGGITALDKTYDGSTAATLMGTATVTALGADVVSVGGTGVAAFNNKNAGTSKPVVVTGYTLTGADAANYVLLQPSTVTATINRAALSLSGVTANNKTYDGSTAATLSGSAAVTALGADVVSVSGSGAGTVFASKNAGTANAVIVNGYALSGADAGNYNLVMPTGLVANVARANLNLTGIVAVDKMYDGTTAAALGGSAAVSALPGDAVSVAGNGSGTFASKDAGIGKAVAVTGYSLTGLEAANYNLVLPSGLHANIAKADLAVTGLSAATKTYDGTTAATLNGNATVNPFGADAVSLTGTVSASFANKSAGIGKPVLVSGFALSGADAGNYNLVQPSGLSATIARAPLVLGGLSVADKIYDGTTAATLGGFATVTALGSDVVTLSGSGYGYFVDKNAGAGKSVLVGGYTLGGADGGNYSLVAPAGLRASIGKASVAVTGVTANDKTYDGTTAATLGGNANVTAIGNDDLRVAGSGSGSFATKDAGTARSVIASGFTLDGLDAGNYDIVQPSGLTATIGKASLAVQGVTAMDKVYDGTSAAGLTGHAGVTGYGNDDLSVSGSGSAAFADKNAGADKAVLASGYSLGGADAGNYTLVQPTGLHAAINKADLVLSGLSANGKVYDGTTAATLSGIAHVDAIGADVVSLAGSGTGAFADKNAGAGKAVTVTGYTLAGADAGNYRLVAPASLAATIARASLAVTGVTAADKTYDGTTSATLGGSAGVAAIGSDDVRVSGNATGTFVDKNVGSGKVVIASGYMLAGRDAANYDIVQPASLTANIGKAALAINGLAAADKTYDGTTAATLSGNASVQAFGADQVSLAGGGIARFADKNAGSGKAVTIGPYALTGADADNYNLVQPTGLRASITPARLLVSGIAASDKIFDGTTAASVSTAGAVLAGRIDADVVTLASSGSFADAAVGTGKTVNLRTTLGGTDAANYTLVDQATTLASITATAETPSAATPPAGLPATTQVQMRNVVAQVQSSVLPPQASPQPLALNLSSTIEIVGADSDKPDADKPRANAGGGAIDTRLAPGVAAPQLRIQNGGVNLPPLAISTAK